MENESKAPLNQDRHCNFQLCDDYVSSYDVRQGPSGVLDASSKLSEAKRMLLRRFWTGNSNVCNMLPYSPNFCSFEIDCRRTNDKKKKFLESSTFANFQNLAFVSWWEWQSSAATLVYFNSIPYCVINTELMMSNSDQPWTIVKKNSRPCS